jgi:hypothetical protein
MSSAGLPCGFVAPMASPNHCQNAAVSQAGGGFLKTTVGPLHVLAPALPGAQRPFQARAFAQHEAVVAGEFAGVIARPQDQKVSLRDDDEFTATFTVSPISLPDSVHMHETTFHISTPSG